MLADFFAFLRDKQIVEVGLAFIISTQVNELATSFSRTVIVPIISALIGGGNDDTPENNSLSQIKIPIGKSYILIGQFVASIINFLLIIFILYLLVRQLSRVTKMFGPVK